MLYAVDVHGKKIPAKKGLVGYCPVCNEELIPRCGEIRIWHWAHKPQSQCVYSEESEWHRWWKLMVPPERCEVVFHSDVGVLRADIVTPAGIVVELQRSNISLKDVRKREYAYGKMIWLFDVFRQKNNEIRYTVDSWFGSYDIEYKQFEIIYKDKYFVRFRWRWAPKILKHITKPIFLDCGDFLIYVTRLYFGSPLYGHGYTWRKSYFIGNVLNGYWIPASLREEQKSG